jgi:hypothetical protein
MNKTSLLFIVLIVLASCSSTKQLPNSKLLPNFAEEEKMVNFVDSVATISIKKPAKTKEIYLVFLKQFKDSLDIYLNRDKVESFYKNDFHYDENGEEYIVHDELAKSEVKIVLLKKKSKNQITIALKNAHKKVSFEIRKEYDIYLVSYYNDHWYFNGTKSKIGK